MALTVTQAIAAARALTAHDAPDTSVTDAQITQWIDAEYTALLRELGVVVPELMTVVVAASITTTATPTFAKAADFDSVQTLERLEGTTYVPVPRADELNSSVGALGWRENPTTIEVTPALSSVGTYRLRYKRGVATGYTTLDLPAGLEWVLVPRVAAWIATRFDDSPAPHTARAEDAWRRAMTVLKQRGGTHPIPGLRITRTY